MSELRVGTRGSDLALAQTRWVCDRLRAVEPGVDIREVVIRTHGDDHPNAPINKDWPAGGFVSAIEQAILGGQIDFAVHSYKDLPTQATPGLIIAAVPEREVAHDVIVLREPVDIDHLPSGFRIGTGSPRRAAQWRRIGSVEIVSVRGNVPTRLMKLESDRLDGIVLAAAGLARLRIDPPHTIALPIDRFLPAPAQGALAIQCQTDSAAILLLARLEHKPSRIRIEAERSLLAAVGPGCHTPVGALAILESPDQTLNSSQSEAMRNATGPLHHMVRGAPGPGEIGSTPATTGTTGGPPASANPSITNKLAHSTDGFTLRLSGQLFADETGLRMVEETRTISIDGAVRLAESIHIAQQLGQELGAELVRRIKSP